MDCKDRGFIQAFIDCELNVMREKICFIWNNVLFVKKSTKN